MMSLDEAIRHCLEVAEQKETKAKYCFKTPWESDDIAKDCVKCAEKHRQLAERLKELKNIYGFIEKYPSTDAIYIGDIKDILKGEI
jgi:HEPN domain-containing protein